MTGEGLETEWLGGGGHQGQVDQQGGGWEREKGARSPEVRG